MCSRHKYKPLTRMNMALHKVILQTIMVFFKCSSNAIKSLGYNYFYLVGVLNIVSFA